LKGDIIIFHPGWSPYLSAGSGIYWACILIREHL
jgi:hypothetical protein